MDINMNKDSGRKALGRGLAALIPDATAPVANTGLRRLPIERIQPNRKQPRKFFEDKALAELASSIKEHGVLQPIVVRKQGDAYEIVAGERRWRASAKAGLHDIPVVIKELTDSAALEAALVENIQRQDLDPLEEAQAFSQLIGEHGLTHEEVAQRVGKNRVTVSNSLRLLKLPPDVLAMLSEGTLNAGHARALMTLEDPNTQLRLAQDIGQRGLSVRDAESRARKITNSKREAKNVARSIAEVGVDDRLQRKLRTKVRLRQRNGKGRLEIQFYSLEELDRILNLIDS
jgi:ParB family chromosome partitioning protein